MIKQAIIQENKPSTFTIMGIIKLNVKYCLNRNSTKNAFHIYNSNIALLNKLQKEFHCSEREHKDLENLPSTFMICYLNGLKRPNKVD
jgi:hypothetical protein